MRVIVPALILLAMIAILGPMSSSLVEGLGRAFGEQAWAVIVLTAFLGFMLVGLHWVMLKYLPDEAEVRNSDGKVVQKYRIRTLLWKAFAAIYVTVLALALYGSGIVEKTHA